MNTTKVAILVVVALVVFGALLTDPEESPPIPLGATFSADGFDFRVSSVEMFGTVTKWSGRNSSDKRSPMERAAGGFGEGLGSGLIKSVVGEGEYDPDAFLMVYLDVTSEWDRPKAPDDLRWFVRDSQGERYSRVVSMGSLGHSPMDPGVLYEDRIVFPILSDARGLRLEVGGVTVDLGSPTL